MNDGVAWGCKSYDTKHLHVNAQVTMWLPRALVKWCFSVYNLLDPTNECQQSSVGTTLKQYVLKY